MYLLAKKALLSSVLVLAAPLWAQAQKSAPQEPEFVPGEYVVALKPQYAQFGIQSTYALSKSLGGKVVNTIPEHGIVVLQRSTVELKNYALQSLKNNPMVRIVEPNYIYRINRTPNDPLLGNLWGLRNVGQNDSGRSPGVAGVDVGAEAAWDIQTGSSNVVVAVIDTGVSLNHPDLVENLWFNEAEKNGQPGIDDDQNGYVDDVNGMDFSNARSPRANGMDDHGHGSHCAGTIGAKGNDGRGIVGVAWDTRIMPVKFLSAQGGGTLEGAILAVDYATKMGAKIMSNSWGGGGFSQTLLEAIQRSNAAGALFVAAAGNDGSSNDRRAVYPASYEVENILTVAAIDNRGNLANFSNYGRVGVDVGAPGVNVYSSVVSGYDSWSGTSMATPHVSGIAALVASQFPEMTALEIKQRIMRTVKPLASLKSTTVSGGLANAYFALTDTVAPPDPNDPVNWDSVPVSFSTPHPYADNFSMTAEIEVPDANEIALFFAKFDTERGYDKLAMYDRAGNLIAELSGSMDESFSPVIRGNYVRLVFTTDSSVTGYGIDVTKAARR